MMARMSGAARASFDRARAIASIAITTALALAASPACSLVGGVSELQGGRRPGPSDAGTKTSEEGGSVDTPEADASTDATVVRGDGGLVDVACGSGVCDPGQGCCVQLGSNASMCLAPANCPTNGFYFLGCTRASSCPRSAPVCCVQSGSGASQCMAACGLAQDELCSPTDPKPCSGTLTCSGTAAGSTIPACE